MLDKMPTQDGRRMAEGGASSLGQSPGYYYPSPWNNDPLGDGYHRGDNNM